MVAIIWAAILQPLQLYFHNCETSSKPFTFLMSSYYTYCNHETFVKRVNKFQLP